MGLHGLCEWPSYRVQCRSLADFLKFIFANSELAKHVHYHWNKGDPNGEVIADFYDGKAYQEAKKRFPFRNDARHIYLTIAADGFQPFKDDRKYSCLPFVLTPMNFPPHMRYER